MDQKDGKIIALLRQDGRIPIREIARKTGIRPSTVHQRIQRLVADTVIEKFTVKLRNASVDEGFIAFLLIATKKDLPASFFSVPQVKEMFGITGEYDLAVKLKFKGVEEFNHYLINLRKYPAIQKTLSMIVTTTLKEEV